MKRVFVCILLIVLCCSCSIDNSTKKEPEYIETCPIGYTDNGVDCEKDVYTEARQVFYCDKGGVLNGTTCTYTTTTEPIITYECPENTELLLTGLCRYTDHVRGEWEYDCRYDDEAVLYDKKGFHYLGTDPYYLYSKDASCIFGTVTPYGIISPTNYCKFYIIGDANKELKCPPGYDRFSNTFPMDSGMCQSDRKVYKIQKKYCLVGELVDDSCIITTTGTAGYYYQCDSGTLTDDLKCYQKEYVDYRLTKKS